MKKALSLILTLALVIGLVPSVFATGEVEYASKTIDFTKKSAAIDSTEYTLNQYKNDAGQGQNIFMTKISSVAKYRNLIWTADPTDTYYGAATTSTQLWLDNNYARHQFNSSYSWGTGDKTHDLIIKTKAPKSGPAAYKLLISHYMWASGGEFEVYLNGKIVDTFISYDATIPSNAPTTRFETETSEAVYTAPDADGYFTIEIRPISALKTLNGEIVTETSGGKAIDLFLNSITVQEASLDELNSFEYMFTLDNSQIIAAETSDTHYVREWKGSVTRTGYIDFGPDMYITKDTWLGNAWVNNFNAYNADGTSVGALTRYRLADSNVIGDRRITTNVRLPEGIWKLTAVTGACTSGGSKAVYANGIYIGSINDYQATFTSSGEAMALSDVELHSTELNPIKMTPDANGYVAITVKVYEIKDTSSTTGTPTYHNHYVPYSYTFERVAESAYPELSNAQLAVAVKDDIGGSVSIDGTVSVDLTNMSTDDDLYVKAVAIGNSVELSATPADGYEFACWEDASGNYISDADTFDYTVYSNAMVYARFDKIGEDAKVGVEFFNGNGDFISFVEKTTEATFKDFAKPTASLTGYTFKGWSVADDTAVDGLVRAVALYEEEGNAIEDDITVDETPISGKKYGEAIPCSKTGAKSWLRGGKTVAYGESFTHYAFGAAEIESSTAAIADKTPLVVLDVIGDDYFIEYDKGGYQILEAGILFGTDEKKTVDACWYKAKVKDLKSHGQFTAKKNTENQDKQTVARGYVIYRLGNSISVVYSD